jgi:hypothetical protein
VGSCLLWILSFAIDMMKMWIEPSVKVCFVFIVHISMELVEACSSEFDVADATLNDVKWDIIVLDLWTNWSLGPLMY